MRIRIVSLLLIVVALSACSKNSTASIEGYFEGRFTYLSSQATGALQRLIVQRGQQVTAGQPLFVVQPQPNNFTYQQAQANVAAAKAKLQDLMKGKREQIIKNDWLALKSAQAQLLFAKQTLARQQALLRSDNTEVATFNQAQQDYKVALSQVHQAQQQIVIDRLAARIDQIKQAEAEVQSAQAVFKEQQWLLKQKTVNAPEAGIIFDTFYYPGEVVPANSPVVALLTPQNTYALFFVTIKQLGSLKLGQTVALSCEDCQPGKAKITYISPRPEYTPPVIYSQSTQTHLVYRVEATPINPKQQYHPGQPTTVTFALKGK